jgi:hypothetical protein
LPVRGRAEPHELRDLLSAEDLAAIEQAREGQSRGGKGGKRGKATETLGREAEARRLRLQHPEKSQRWIALKMQKEHLTSQGLSEKTLEGIVGNSLRDFKKKSS